MYCTTVSPGIVRVHCPTSQRRRPYYDLAAAVRARRVPFKGTNRQGREPKTVQRSPRTFLNFRFIEYSLRRPRRFKIGLRGGERPTKYNRSAGNRRELWRDGRSTIGLPGRNRTRENGHGPRRKARASFASFQTRVKRKRFSCFEISRLAKDSLRRVSTFQRCDDE